MRNKDSYNVAGLVSHIASKANKKVDMGVFAAELMDQFEGEAGLAREVKSQYRACEKDGSAAKLNILSNIVTMMGKVYEINVRQQKESAEAPLSNEELAKYAGPLFEELGLGEKLRELESSSTADAGGSEPCTSGDGACDHPQEPARPEPSQESA